jgi:hypothetical protein
MLDSLILNDQATKTQAKLSGNRCGHVPDAPRFYCRPAHHKSRPSLLEEAIEKLTAGYKRPKRFLRKLFDLHPKGRLKRSERREAIASVSQVLLHYLELETLQVGFYTLPNVFVSLDLKYIAKQAGLSLLRARRAINDLVKAGYVKLLRQFNKNEEGQFKGLASIRELTASFFSDLGIDSHHLFFLREWKRKKQEKALAKQGKKKLRGILQAAVFLGKKIAPTTTKKERPPAQARFTKEQLTRALELHRANPARSPSDYLQELQKLKE